MKKLISSSLIVFALAHIVFSMAPASANGRVQLQAGNGWGFWVYQWTDTTLWEGGSVKWVGIAGTAQPKEKDDLITVIKNGINRVLGILSLITLILLLWGGFQMVTANGDDKKAKAGLTILKQAAIGLGFIAVSRFIVSIIFRVIAWTGAWVDSKSTWVDSKST